MSTHETITACENVCRDFSWLVPFSDVLSNLAVIAGVVIALQQLRLSREEANLRRKKELGEEMLVALAQTEDAFRFFRNPFDSIPQEKVGDREFIYRKRYERLKDQESVFLRLREIQIRCEAVMGEIGIREHVTRLFNFRTDIALAIEDLADARSRDHRQTDLDRKMRRILYGTWGPNDEFGTQILIEIRMIKTIICRVSGLNGDTK